MVNSGPNSNHTEFMITLKELPFLDNKYVAIGRLVDGEQTLAALERVKCDCEKPLQRIEIGKINEV